MANIGSAYLTIFPSMDGFAAKLQSELGGVNVSAIGDKLGDQLGDGISSGMSRAAKGTSGLSGKLSALSGVAMGVAGEIAGRLFDAVMNLSGEMVEASDSATKFASTLSFAGIDDSTIKQLTQSTQEYADKTVYDLADIRNVTAQLAANGVKDYAQLAEAAGNLNAVAGGSSDTFRSVSMVMSQTAGQGKLVTENWNQLTDAIPGASGALQDAMREAGAFSGNFREAMEDGEISADEFFAAVQKLGMQDVAVEAATSTSTIEGALGNLQAAVVGVGSQVIDAVKPMVTGAMDELSTLITGLPSAFESAMPVLQRIVTWVKPIGTALVSAFEQVAPAVSSMAQTLGPLLMPLLQSISSVVAGLVPVLATVATTVMDTVTQIGSFVIPAVTRVLGLIKTNLPAIQTIVTAVVTHISGVIQTAMTVIKAVWDAVWPALSSMVTTTLTIIKTAVETAMGVIQGIIDAVMAAISGDWDGAWAAIRGVADTVWSGILSIARTALELLWGAISSALSTISGAWSSAWSAVSDLLAQAWEGIKSGVSSGVDFVVGVLQGLPGTIVGIFSGAGSWLVESGRALLQGFADGVMGAVGWVGDQISGALSTIRSLFPFSPAKRGPFSGHGYTTYSGKALMTDFGASIARSGASAVSAAMGVMSDVSAALAPDAGSLCAVGADVGYRPSGVSYGPDGDDGLTSAIAAAVSEALAGMGVYLDGGKVVGALGPRMNRELGRIQRRGALA